MVGDMPGQWMKRSCSQKCCTNSAAWRRFTVNVSENYSVCCGFLLMFACLCSLCACWRTRACLGAHTVDGAFSLPASLRCRYRGAVWDAPIKDEFAYASHLIHWLILKGEQTVGVLGADVKYAGCCAPSKWSWLSAFMRDARSKLKQKDMEPSLSCH